MAGNQISYALFHQRRKRSLDHVSASKEVLSKRLLFKIPSKHWMREFRVEIGTHLVDAGVDIVVLIVNPEHDRRSKLRHVLANQCEFEEGTVTALGEIHGPRLAG